MRRTWIAGTLATVGVLVAAAALPGHAKPAPKCAPSAKPVLYPAVESTFVRKCSGCHDSRKATNVPAQRVFEMSSYPFSTERPKTLLHDLRGMFQSRGGLTDAERCDGMHWIDGGGLDANGKIPAWR